MPGTNVLFLLLRSFILTLFLLTISTERVFASSFSKYPGNPIFSPDPSSAWDSRHVANPFVLKEAGGYKMWYQGHGGLRWAIGYAAALDGISGWSRINNPVVAVGSSDGWETDIGDPNVLYDSTTGNYKMWYTSFNATIPSGPDRSRVRFATSSDGINWVKGDWVLRGTTGNWDSGGIHRGHSIIYKDGTYHLWYGGINDSSWSSLILRIGYATSSDGINWTKQNGGNPVITPTDPWELNNVSFPTVIDDGGIWKMWYISSVTQVPQNIVYAYSADGINWIKPALENPILTPGVSGNFDSNYLTVTAALHDTDIYRLYYSGLDGLNWRIGLATGSPSDITPTPTPLATPTPTPTPEATDTVVIIPGMGQSWNADALTHCEDENYDGNWTLASWAEDTYQPLLDSFVGSALSPIPYYYDWRKQVTSHTTGLATFISDLTGPTERIDLVGHSMGGLVGRAYLEEQGDSHKLDKFLTAGSPHGGAAFAYPAWSGGEIWLGNLPERIGMTLLLKACGLLTNQREVIQLHVPSVQNVLPTEDYLRNHSTGLLKPIGTMDAKNNWLPTSFGLPFFGATVGTLDGINKRTLETIEVRNRTRRDEVLGNWADGKPMGRNEDGNGDGLVLPSSAELPGADNRLITQSHSKLVSSPAGIAEIHNFLGISAPLTITQTEEPTRAMVVVANPAIFWVEGPSGQVKKDKAGSITFFDPPAGNYKLRLVPTSSETTLFVGQFLANGKYLWKDYKFKNFLPKFSTIEFDSTTLLENPLK